MLKNLPWFGLGIGLLLALVTLVANPLGANGDGGIPTLAMLFMTELGALISLSAVIISIREQLQKGVQMTALMTTIGNGLLLAYFANFGMNVWNMINA